jgi:hypothetical protein
MEPASQPQHEQMGASPESFNEKSELMRIFEYQISDSEWAYKELLRAILEAESGEA